MVNVDFLETLRRDLCNRVIKYYMLVDIFWCLYLSLKNTLEMLINLTRAISRVLEPQKW
jgi:thiamine kinase-like enzyme